MPSLQTVVSEIADEMRTRTDRGEVASYIPELARVDPSQFGLCVVDADGNVAAGGDAETPFSIQSISKVFTLTLALGRSATGSGGASGASPPAAPSIPSSSSNTRRAFRAIPSSMPARSRLPTSSSPATSPREALGEILRFMQFLADDATHHHRQGRRGLRAADRVSQRRAGQLHEIVRRAGQPGGVHARRLFPPLRDRHVVPATRHGRAVPRPTRAQPLDRALPWCQPERARRINALMLTCGHYDGSGEFAYRVGLPGKSGVGGGILAIAPGKASIAVWSPGLDASGNSHLGQHRARGADTADGLVDLRLSRHAEGSPKLMAGAQPIDSSGVKAQGLRAARLADGRVVVPAAAERQALRRTAPCVPGLPRFRPGPVAGPSGPERKTSRSWPYREQASVICMTPRWVP